MADSAEKVGWDFSAEKYAHEIEILNSRTDIRIRA
jgi:hypothetical protein